MDGLGELAGVGQVGGLGLHPQQVRERRCGKGFGDRVRDAAADLVVALGGLRPLAVPGGVHTELAGLLPRRVQRRGLGERAPVRDAHVQRLALALAELQQFGDGVPVGLQPGVVLPGLHELRLDPVEDRVHGVLAAVLPGGGRLGDRGGDAVALEPGIGDGVLALGQGVEQVAVELGDAGGVEAAHHGQEARLVGRDLEVGGAEQERLVALVGAALDEVGRLGVGAGHDDARHPHDVELEACGVEPLDLLVGRHQHLAALMAALLGARPLVLDVVAGHAGLDEAADQVADVRISTVAGVGVGDDERPVVDRGRGRPLLFGHLQPQEVLVAVGGEQGPHQAGGLVGHLAQRIAGEVGAGVLGDRSLGRGGPAAEVDALDAHSLHGHGLAGGVRPEGGDALLLGEQLAQPLVEGLGGLARDGVVDRDGAALLDDLPRAVEAGDPLEPRTVDVPLGVGDLLVESRLGLCVRFDDGHESLRSSVSRFPRRHQRPGDQF